jgi:hypothetical protein
MRIDKGFYKALMRKGVGTTKSPKQKNIPSKFNSLKQSPCKFSLKTLENIKKR